MFSFTHPCVPQVLPTLKSNFQLSLICSKVFSPMLTHLLSYYTTIALAVLSKWKPLHDDFSFDLIQSSASSKEPIKNQATEPLWVSMTLPLTRSIKKYIECICLGKARQMLHVTKMTDEL